MATLFRVFVLQECHGWEHETALVDYLGNRPDLCEQLGFGTLPANRHCSEAGTSGSPLTSGRLSRRRLERSLSKPRMQVSRFRVNRAIDSVDDIELEERAALFDDCFERCRDLYASDNGYQRQSVVRFAAALYPGLAFRTVGADRTDAVLPDDWTLDEIATHRHRLREFYLDALVDDDGRVRRAAAKGLKELAVAAELIGAEDELQTMLAELETLAENHNDESVQKHINQARENVAFHAQKPGSLLPEGLRDAFE